MILGKEDQEYLLNDGKPVLGWYCKLLCAIRPFKRTRRVLDF